MTRREARRGEVRFRVAYRGAKEACDHVQEGESQRAKNVLEVATDAEEREPAWRAHGKWRASVAVSCDRAALGGLACRLASRCVSAHIEDEVDDAGVEPVASSQPPPLVVRRRCKHECIVLPAHCIQYRRCWPNHKIGLACARRAPERLEAPTVGADLEDKHDHTRDDDDHADVRGLAAWRNHRNLDFPHHNCVRWWCPTVLQKDTTVLPTRRSSSAHIGGRLPPDRRACRPAWHVYPCSVCVSVQRLQAQRQGYGREGKAAWV